MGAISAGHGQSTLPLGLVLGVVFADSEQRELRDAAVRLEPIFGRRLVRQPAIRLAFAAGRIVGRVDRPKAETCQFRAAEWLERLHIEQFAHLSDQVALGFDQRLGHAAEALRMAVEGIKKLAVAEDTVEQVSRHDHARQDEMRAARARMALRLARWLTSPEPAPARLAEMAARYTSEGGFVDLARNTILGGDPLSDVSAVYGLINDRATARRERENETFAALESGWYPIRRCSAG
jgi:hypothetical protein